MSVSRICEVCQSPFSVKPYVVKIGQGRFCTDKCRTTASRKDPLENFWSKVDKQTCLGEICGCHKGIGCCWPYMGARFTNGYGVFTVKKKAMRAHRFALESERGLLLPGFLACHHCDVKHCCRVSHLWPGTTDDNMKDAAIKGIMQRVADTRKPRAIETFARGEKIHQARLTEDQAIWALCLRGQSPIDEVAHTFHVSRSTIWRLWNRVTWKHLPMATYDQHGSL